MRELFCFRSSENHRKYVAKQKYFISIWNLLSSFQTAGKIIWNQDHCYQSFNVTEIRKQLKKVTFIRVSRTRFLTLCDGFPILLDKFSSRGELFLLSPVSQTVNLISSFSTYLTVLRQKTKLKTRYVRDFHHCNGFLKIITLVFHTMWFLDDAVWNMATSLKLSFISHTENLLAIQPSTKLL